MSEETTAPQEVGLSYGDIKACVQIIDVTCNRGAIRGDELVQVGTVRERLVAFLKYAKDQGEDVGELPEVPPTGSEPAEEVE